MSTATHTDTGLRKLWRPQKASIVGLALVAPLATVIILVLLVPLFRFALFSVDNRNTQQWLTHTAQALEGWDGTTIPGDAAFAAMALDLSLSGEDAAKLASKLNFFQSGMISLVRKTAGNLDEIAPTRASFEAFDRQWGDLKTWRAIGLGAKAFTAEHYLNAVDLRTANPSDLLSIEVQPERKQIYVKLWVRTILVAVSVVCISIAIGYPLAYYLSSVQGYTFILGMGFVLLPFWTPLLARIASWQVLLESTGVIKSVLVGSGLVSDSNVPQLFNNLFASILVMSYVLLPYAVLPTYAVMKKVPPSLFVAALTLGASPVRAFFTVYLPQTLPGVLAGGILIFVFSFGFYLTPELVGGPGGSLIGNQIAYNFAKSLNWGLAGALSTMLIVVIAAAALLLRIVAPRQSLTS